MDDRFEVAAGSVVGRMHLRELAWRNNQDACAFTVTPAALVAVVCDGCGAEPHSEVGAHLGARLTLAAVLERAGRGDDVIAPGFWDDVEHDVLDRIAALARAMGGSARRVIHEHFLFTVCGAVVTDSLTALFALGDGVMYLNGERVALPSFPDNAPPYLAYRLVDGCRHFGVDTLHIRVRAARSTRLVESVLIGSDGAADLGAPAGERPGAMERFWTDDAYFKNPHAIARRLALLNRRPRPSDRVRAGAPLVTAGLQDDTTIVVIRRRVSC